MAEQPAGSRAAGSMPWLLRAIAMLAGAALTAAFAPHDVWCLALLCPAMLVGLWTRAASAREGAWLGFAFGLGLYAAGTWWLFISIHGFGQAPVWVALPVMAALVMIMAAWQALLGYVAVRWLAPRSAPGCLLLVPAAWVIVEWWRGWFLSGFPWLSLGYSQTDTWLAGLAPVGGVHLVSLALLVCAGGLVHLWRARGVARWLAPVALILPWTTGLSLRDIEWTKVSGPARTVAILQGAIPQDMKWLLSNQQNILDTYERLHREALGANLIIWPESALPDLANLYPNYIATVWSAARRSNSAMLMGVIREAQSDAGADAEPFYFNSLLGMGSGEPAFYDKRHLVPFGEYFPVPSWLRNWMRLMNLPYSDFTPGDARQPLFDLAGMRLAASICYEDAYPAMMNPETRLADALVTVTNDGWFSHSGARYQHLQIARMRALESRRYLLRAANDGVSAVINPFGKVTGRAQEFTEAVLRGSLTPRQGATPYLLLGNWLVIGLAGVILAGAVFGGLRKARGGTISRINRLS
ncbi:MAG: apolipoprotein N-acyltransferase [Steroidobacteraceae bacterium]